MNTDDLKLIVADPRESLAVELKRWLDLARDEGKAKVVKACIALRNNDGGTLLIGFRDDGKPDIGNEPINVRTAFHADILQPLIGKYSSSQFEVRVEFISRDGIEYPAIIVPKGITAPIACKGDLPNDGSLLRANSVYVRTLNANHTVSSSPATWKDWTELSERCFSNREADIGAFIRRHLAGLDVAQMAEAFGQIKSVVAHASSSELAQALLIDGRNRFNLASKKRSVVLPEKLGFREMAVVVEGEGIDIHPNSEMLWRLRAETPDYSGWPPWIILPDGPDDKLSPYVFDDAWEALIDEVISVRHLDFWRIDPHGRFYHLRGLEEDLSSNAQQAPAPNVVLDFFLEASRAVESLAVALSLVKSLGFDTTTSTITVAHRLTNLEGRFLTCYVQPRRHYTAPTKAYQNEITTTCTIPADTPFSALTSFIERLVQPVFSLFGGNLSSSVIDGIVDETLSRGR